MSEVGDICYDDTYCGDYNDTKFGAGIVLMFIGPALILISTPMLIVRGMRETRMRRTEATIHQLGGTVAFTPLFGPREAGFRLRVRF